jgi:pentatricopeptide repeat protein
MFDVGLRPNANAFNKVIDGLVKVDRIEEAQGFFDLMPEKEVKPNIASYELLLRAYTNAAKLDDAIKMAKGILLDESVVFTDELKALLEGALEKEGRNGDMTKLYEDVETEKAEAAARAAEEKARAEALAKEEEEKKKAEAKAKEESAARAWYPASSSISSQQHHHQAVFSQQKQHPVRLLHSHSTTTRTKPSRQDQVPPSPRTRARSRPPAPHHPNTSAGTAALAWNWPPAFTAESPPARAERRFRALIPCCLVECLDLAACFSSATELP